MKPWTLYHAFEANTVDKISDCAFENSYDLLPRDNLGWDFFESTGEHWQYMVGMSTVACYEDIGSFFISTHIYLGESDVSWS